MIEYIFNISFNRIQNTRGNSLQEGLSPFLNAPLQWISSPTETGEEIPLTPSLQMVMPGVLCSFSVLCLGWWGSLTGQATDAARVVSGNR